MDASKSHFMGLILASIVIVFFTVVATIVIVTWSPILHEALADDMGRDANNIAKQMNDFAPYIALHKTESWHYTAALNDLMAIADCPK
ncbi:hypothetical protein [Herminiimonas fonticola]|uniref:Uncharacterized protein n=1 Tax=Herminiimonas fonticola TaxID=303380 RepID=A0A4V3BV85_9BURK|nr:hypothetical protein [Herminiimonas fonticola]RBA24098.1 hypothetical protein Hfont_1910 [Herminiimonas fonticola]TDN90098.1 hypothetical protein EV677_2171 [Herminiimonas fonticola]